MSVNIHTVGIEMKKYIGDFLNHRDFIAYTIQENNVPEFITSTNHMIFCVPKTKLYPQLQDYVKQFLKTTNDVDMNILSRVMCHSYFGVAFELFKYVIEFCNTNLNICLFFLVQSYVFSSEVIRYFDLLINKGANVNHIIHNKTLIEHFLESCKINFRSTTEESYREIIMYILSKGATVSNLNVSFCGLDTERRIFESCVDDWSLRNVKSARKNVQS